MIISLKPLISIATLGITLSAMPMAIAREILTSAEVYGIHREVNLHRFQEKKAKPTAMGEAMYPKDLMKTGAESWVKLLFNEGTLLRLDAHDVFRFLPNTRSFELKHGVILSLVYPGRGTTTLLTPEANVIVMGTALIVRHDSDAKETQVGLLTEKNGAPVYVTLPNGSNRVKLRAGDRVTIQDGQMGEVSQFNLEQFYDVCEISHGLAPAEQSMIATEPSNTQDTWQVIREETQEALVNQQIEGTIPEDNGSSLCEPVKAPPKDKKKRRSPSFNFNFGGGGGGARPPTGGRP